MNIIIKKRIEVEYYFMFSFLDVKCPNSLSDNSDIF